MKTEMDVAEYPVRQFLSSRIDLLDDGRLELFLVCVPEILVYLQTTDLLGVLLGNQCS